MRPRDHTSTWTETSRSTDPRPTTSSGSAERGPGPGDDYPGPETDGGLDTGVQLKTIVGFRCRSCEWFAIDESGTYGPDCLVCGGLIDYKWITESVVFGDHDDDPLIRAPKRGGDDR